MTHQEPDRELKEWLGAYDVEDIDTASRDALMNKIMAEVSSSPQRKAFAFSLPSLRGWFDEAAALAAAAVLGFWIGVGTPALSTSQTGEATEVASSSSVSTYLGESVFGPTSWKEVSL